MQTRRTSLAVDLRKDVFLYILLVPLILYYIIFHYIPMYGVVISFQDFNMFKGVFGSRWIGFENFRRILRSQDFFLVVRNTLFLNLLDLVFGFPVPIALALLLNELGSMGFKRAIQTILYLPHFMSWVILTNLIIIMLSPSTGVVNGILSRIGITPIYFLGNKGWWVFTYIVSGIYRSAGWGSIVYLAALSAVSPHLYESAMVDGAGRWRQMRSITLPSIYPTIIVILLLRIGHLVSIGFEHVYLLQNSIVLDVADVISTYVYRIGLLRADFARATAVGLFQSVINCAVLFTANWLARKIRKEGLY